MKTPFKKNQRTRLKRKRLVSNTPSSAAFESNDDSAEKIQSRVYNRTSKKQKNVKRRRRSTIGGGFWGTPQTGKKRTKEVLSKNELNDMYGNVLHLCQKNKITSKNAWDLNITDYVADIIGLKQHNKNGDKSILSFQKAAMLLDAATKVYGCRVDSLGNNFNQVLYNVSGGTSGLIDGNDNNSINSKNNNKKGKNHYGVNKITICKEREITVDVSSLTSLIDPMQYKTKSSFSASDACGLFLLSLKVINGKIALHQKTKISYNQYNSPDN